MSTCSRCRQYNCNSLCGLGACKTCGGYACKGNCNIPRGYKSPSLYSRCGVCGVEYMNSHNCQRIRPETLNNLSRYGSQGLYKK